jgi:predicted DNA binding protein
MRYATVSLTPGEGGFHPVDRSLAIDPSVRRESIEQVNLLDDGTAVMLYALRGDMARAADLIAGHEDIIDHEVSGDGEGLAYVHFRPNPRTRTLLDIVQQNEIILKTPVECIDDGGIRFTVLGDGSVIQRAIGDIPPELTLSLERMGDYHPDTDELFSSLTERQQEILEAAVELGYYEVPRRTTHEAIAETVGLSAGTVGEHLRKVEGRVLSALVN